MGKGENARGTGGCQKHGDKGLLRDKVWGGVSCEGERGKGSPGAQSILH